MCGVMDPHPPAVPHIKVQSTPALLLSFVTVASSRPVAPTATDSVAGTTATVMGEIAMVAVADLVGSVMEVAVMVTVPPTGDAPGAV